MLCENLEKRQYYFEIRAGEQKGAAVVTGQPIVYESKTDLYYFDEVIEKGALDHTDLKDVVFLVNHDMAKIPLARAKEGSDHSTMSLEVNKKGLFIEVQLDIENNTEAKSLYSAIKRGDITGMSFLFEVAKEEWENLDTEHPTRYIKEIKRVLEVSAVTFPAYEATHISARGKEDFQKMVDSKRENQNLELEKLKALYLYCSV